MQKKLQISNSLLALCGNRLFSPPYQEMRYLGRYIIARDVAALACYNSQDHSHLDTLQTDRAVCKPGVVRSLSCMLLGWIPLDYIYFKIYMNPVELHQRLDVTHTIEYRASTSCHCNTATKFSKTHGTIMRELNYLPNITQQIFGRNKNEPRSPSSLLCNLTSFPYMYL